MSLKRNIAKSNILDVSIKYKGDYIKFNLGQELIIDENKINEELQLQPSYYGFLCMLSVKLKRVRDDLKAEMKKTYTKEYIHFKSQVNDETRRVTSNDLADAMAIDSKTFQRSQKAYHKAEENLGIVESCVNSFEQRSNLIQSLSANLREERNNYKHS